MAPTSSRPIPGSAKIDLDDHRAADQAADIDAGDGDQGQRRGLQGVHEQDARRLQSLGPAPSRCSPPAGSRSCRSAARASAPAIRRAPASAPAARSSANCRPDLRRTARSRSPAASAARPRTDRSAGSPTRNVGTDSMPKAVPVMKRSNAPPLRTAQAMASGMPIASAAELGQEHQLERYRQPFGDGLQHGLPGAERSAEIALQHMAEPARDSATRSADRAPCHGATPRPSPASPDRPGSRRRDRPAAARRSGRSAAIRRPEPAPDTGAFARQSPASARYSSQASDTSITPP